MPPQHEGESPRIFHPQGRIRAHILVTGPPGSGKTFVSAALRLRGVNALDADTISGLCGWFDIKGNRVPYLPDADKHFLDNHVFRWDRSVLIDFLARQNEVYLFGSSSNVFDMVDLFDQVFFLKAAPELLAERLRSEGRTNPMGRTDYQLEYCLFRARTHETIACNLHIPMLPAMESPARIYSHIRRGDTTSGFVRPLLLPP